MPKMMTMMMMMMITIIHKGLAPGGRMTGALEAAVWRHNLTPWI
jgi:hypothetical protein